MMRRTLRWPAGRRATLAGLLLSAATLAAAQTPPPDPPADVLQQARAATDRRDHARALAAYEQLLAQRADDVDLLIEAARVNGFADRNAEAARLYRRALALAPQRRGDIVPSLAWQSLWGGQPAEAALLFNERAASSASSAADRLDALDGLGQARQAQGDQAGALQAFREAHALASDHLRLHRRLATSLLWNGLEDEAIAELKLLRQRAPEDRDIAWALANALNFAGLHREALAGFLAQAAPVHPGERADLARAWRWAGYEDKAWPLLADPTDADGRWLRDWRVRRDLAPFGYASVERSEDRDRLTSRAAVLGGGWHPQPGATLDFQLRRLQLDDPFGRPDATQFQASWRWRLGEPGNGWGTLWPTLALRASHFPGWSPLAPTARLTWIPRDRWRLDAEATRELVEAPRAVANRVTVDVLGAGFEHRPSSNWLLAGSAAALRFDDGTTRLRLNGRAERALLARPRIMLGVEGLAFDRVNDGRPGADDRGYWNPQRYVEARAYVSLVHEMRPFDIVARIGVGASREVDGGGTTSNGHPHLWELGLGWDLNPGLRLRLSAGGSGQGMGVSGGGAGYWRRYVSLSANVWF